MLRLYTRTRPATLRRLSSSSQPSNSTNLPNRPQETTQPPPILQPINNSLSQTDPPRHHSKPIYLLSATVISAITAITLCTQHDTNNNKLYTDLQHTIEKSKHSIYVIYNQMSQTVAAATVLLKSLKSVLTSANQEVRLGFELRVAALLADIVAANEGRREAIVSAGGGAVVDWLLEKVVLCSRENCGTQSEAARALAHLISDQNVCEAVLGRPHAVPYLLRFIFSFQPQRNNKIGVLEDTRNRTLHGILRLQSCFRGHQARSYLKELRRGICTLQSFVRGENSRNEYAILLQRHRAAVVIQRQMKGKVARKIFLNSREASIVIQSVIRGRLVRRCSGDVGLLISNSSKGSEPDQVLLKASVLAELQRRVLKAEAALRDKEEENDILHQRLQQYETRWSEYELKMKSMEEVWQKQMRSLQSSLSIAKKSLAADDSERKSDASVNVIHNREYSWESTGNKASESNGVKAGSRILDKEMSAGLSVISRLAEEFEQRRQVFSDDAKFLVEVKSGQAEASLNPDRELRKLKQIFENWKKDYGNRLRETKVVLHKLGSEEGHSSNEKSKKKWWGRLNSSRIN